MSDSSDEFRLTAVQAANTPAANVIEFRRPEDAGPPRVAELPRAADCWNVDELSRANAKLQEFAWTVAHEVKEPLRTISLLTQLLARKAKLDEPATEIARHILAGVSRISSLLDHLLSSPAVVIESPRPEDLEDAAAQATRNLNGAIGPKCR